MTQVAARKMDVRCFLEGIEVPCVSAAVSVNFDAPATCAIQCIPTASSTKLKARTSVHVFFRDIADPTGPYRLMFLGEIIGYQYSKTPTSLSIIYQAVDDSSYWDTAYQYFVDYGRGADWLFQQKSSFMGTGNALFDSVFREHASVIAGLLRTSPKTYPQLRGLVGGVVHILEAVGGAQGKFKGFNDFFTMAELRRKILAQVSASEADETSIRIYNHKVFWQWIMRQLGSAGSMVSMRDMIKLLFRYIFHNVVPNPIAKYDPEGQKDIRVSRYKFENTAKGKRVTALLTNAALRVSNYVVAAKQLNNRALTRARNALLSSTTDSGVVVKAVNQATAQTLSEHKAMLRQFEGMLNTTLRELKKAAPEVTGITRALGKITAAQVKIDEIKIDASSIKDLLGRTVKGEPSTGPGGIISGFFVKVDTLHPTWWDTMYRLYGFSSPNSYWERRGFNSTTVDLLTGSERRQLRELGLPWRVSFKVPSVKVRISTKLNELYELISGALQDLGITLRLTRDLTPRERLHNQIMRPDIWFVAPPKCNVIFPDDYISFQYNRNFLQEVTRMELTTAMELIGSNSITNSRYFAPNIQDITGKYVLQSARSGVRLIMPHEVYTGILPKFEFMSEANIYAASADQKQALKTEEKLLREQARYLRAQSQQLRSGSINQGGAQELIQQYETRARKLEARATSLSVGGLPYIQRAVNFMYFKQRFSSRSLGLQGQFLWRVVAGFPGLVINKPSLAFDDKPSQFMGMVAGMNHTASQQGSTSQITFSQGREHGGVDDEFLGIDGGVLQNIRLGKSKTTRVLTGTLDAQFQAKNRRLNQLASIQNPSASQKRVTAKVLKEQTRLSRLAEFITNYERRRDRGQSVKGMIGPNGGTVVSVRAIGERKKIKVSENLKRAQELLKSRQRLVGGPLVLQSDVDSASARVNQLTVNRGGLNTDTRYHDRYIIKEAFTTVRRKITLPVEEQIFPTWMSPIYRNENIGKKKIRGREGPYQQFFGCGAITDDPGDNTQGRKDYQAALSDPDQTVVGSLKPSKSIEEAVDELVAAYKRVRDTGLDVRDFIDTYTNRPVATMEEILGTADLEVDDNGRVKQGRAGFHSFAFGDYSNLEGLRDVKARIAGGRGQQAKVARGLDTRSSKRQAVLQYRKELNRGQGQLGG